MARNKTMNMGRAVFDVVSNLEQFERDCNRVDSALGNLKTRAATAHAAMQAGGAGVAAATAEYVRLTQAIQLLEAAQKNLSTGQAAIGAGTMLDQLNRKSVSLAQTFDDLQYVGEQGLRPILNNLVQINPYLGVAAIAVDLLYKHWSSLMEAFAGGSGAVKTASEEIKELGDILHRTADEEERLQKLTEKRKNGEAIAEMKPAEQVEQQKGLKDIAAEFPNLIEPAMIAADPNIMEEAKKEADAAPNREWFFKRWYDKAGANITARIDGVNPMTGMTGFFGGAGVDAAVDGVDERANEWRKGAAQQKANQKANDQFGDMNEVETRGLITRLKGLPDAVKALDSMKRLDQFIVALEATLPEVKAAQEELEAGIPMTVKKQQEANKRHKEAEKARLKSLQDAEDEAEKDADDADKKANKTAESISEGLMADGSFEATEAEVERRAKAAGVRDADIPKITRRANAIMGKKVEQAALERGLNTEDTKTALTGEANERKDRRDQQLQSKLDKESLDKAKSAFPELGKNLAVAFGGQLANGGQLARITNDLTDKATARLMEKGLNPEEAARSARQLVGEASEKAREAMDSRVVRPFQSESIEIAQFAGKMLTGNNAQDDAAQKQLTALEKSNALLGRIEDKIGQARVGR